MSEYREREWVEYWKSDIAGDKELNLPQRYAILLVLEGEITLTFNGYLSQHIHRKSLIVIDTKPLSNFHWEAETAMLVFTPPEKIFRFFRNCSNAFSVPCSTVVPMLPELERWVDELMATQLLPKHKSDEACQQGFCMRLSNILKHYPPLLVGELIIAFQACTISGEKQCKCKLCK